ncbi:Mic60p [Sporobolomyces salmoneus]|uniref:Mic60p n=1 Tax=Sporobolomyces salmoneus TaxID=183962 RepID=UPI00317CC6E9
MLRSATTRLASVTRASQSRLGPSSISRTTLVARSSRQGFATAPTKSNVLPNPNLSSRLPPPPPKPRKSLTRRILSPILLLTLAFYGVSVPIGYFSVRYRDFLAETVPGGLEISEFLDDIEIKSAVGSLPAPDTNAKPLAKGKETELTRYAETKAKSEGWTLQKMVSQADPSKAAEDVKTRFANEAHNAKEVAKDKIQAAVEAAKVRAGELKQASQKAVGVVEDKVNELSHAAKDVKNEAVTAAKKVSDSAPTPAPVSSKTTEPRLVDNVAAGSAEPKTDLPVYAQKPRQLDATPIPPKRANNEVYQGPPLPIGFEPAPGYEVARPPPTPKGEIKPVTPPPAPLPLVAPALKDVTTSEPMLGQLASTIDSLAKYVEKNDAFASESATHVLSDAQKDIKGLAARVEAIKKAEEEKLQQQLKEQAGKYSGMLLKAEKELVERLDTQEEDWKKAFDSERENLVKAYKEKLDQELATQQEIINQRLKEEVVAQGIEMQRRWVDEIKTRVEKERGGRLAKLEELEGGVRKLEQVAKQNEEVLGEAVRARKIFTAVKALEHKIEAGLPFSDELAALQKLSSSSSSSSDSSSSTSDSLIALALKSVPSDVASTGVTSFPALAARFSDSVAPQLKKVSLYPQHGGLLAYLSSYVASHAMFEKDGWADGDDVISTIARAKFWLANKDLDLAAREVNSLKGWPKALASDWLKAARNHLEVKLALEVAEREATAESLKAL